MTGVLDDLVAPGIKPLLFDRSSATRKSVLAAVGAWLGASSDDTRVEARDSRIDWRPRIGKLLPLLLVGLTDEASEVSSMALVLLDEVRLYAVQYCGHVCQAGAYGAMRIAGCYDIAVQI